MDGRSRLDRRNLDRRGTSDANSSSETAADQDKGQSADDKKAESTAAPADESKKDKVEDSGRNAVAAETRSRSAEMKPRTGSGRSVSLNLVIAGLGREGCDIEVKPGNAGCKFRSVYGQGKEGLQHVTSRAVLGRGAS